MRGFGDQLANHTDNFGQLIHQLLAVLQTASGINNQNICAGRDGLFNRPIGQRSSITAAFAGNHRCICAQSPACQLFNCGCPEGVSGCQHH